jgi:hypothetical protein
MALGSTAVLDTSPEPRDGKNDRDLENLKLLEGLSNCCLDARVELKLLEFGIPKFSSSSNENE